MTRSPLTCLPNSRNLSVHTSHAAQWILTSVPYHHMLRLRNLSNVLDNLHILRIREGNRWGHSQEIFAECETCCILQDSYPQEATQMGWRGNNRWGCHPVEDKGAPTVFMQDNGKSGGSPCVHDTCALEPVKPLDPSQTKICQPWQPNTSDSSTCISLLWVEAILTILTVSL
jgi:hypothetical protein